MEDTTVSIIGIVLSAIIMLIVPVVLISDRSDDISQLLIQTTTSEFVNDVITTGKITREKYVEFIQSLQSSGNAYEIDMEVKILDENTSQKVVNQYGHEGKVGNNTYYSIYTSQIEEIIENIDESAPQELLLKQGDGISVTIRNSSKTFSQSLKSFYYKTAEEGIHILSATASGTVAIDGRT